MAAPRAVMPLGVRAPRRAGPPASAGGEFRLPVWLAFLLAVSLVLAGGYGYARFVLPLSESAAPPAPVHIVDSVGEADGGVVELPRQPAQPTVHHHPQHDHNHGAKVDTPVVAPPPTQPRTSIRKAPSSAADRGVTHYATAAAGGSNSAAGAIAPLPVANTVPRALRFCDEAACTNVTRVIAISLYGADGRYTHGAIRNSELVRDAFPDWQLWVYIPDSSRDPNLRVPEDVVKTLVANGAVIVPVDRATMDTVGFGMNQRFLIAEDPRVHRFVVRDGDSRMLLRERYALDAWERDGSPFHVLRDHPSHSNFYISGGLWGATKGALADIRQLLAASNTDKQGYLGDMDFLNKHVWPIMETKGVYQNDAYSCFRVGANAHPFPVPRAGGEHVGGVYQNGDVLRAGDIALLPASEPDQCRSPALPASARLDVSLADVLTCAKRHEDGGLHVTAPSPAPGAASCAADSQMRLDGIHYLGATGAVLPGLTAGRTFTAFTVMLHWTKAFVDPVYARCGSSATVAPSAVFDHTRILRYDDLPAACVAAGQKPWAQPAQYHERVQPGGTHYSSFGEGGLRHARHMLVVQAWYSNDPHYHFAFAVPHLLTFLHTGPRVAKALLPDIDVVDTVITTLYKAGVLYHVLTDSPAWREYMAANHRSGATVPPANWRYEAWVALQLSPPHLYYAHHAYIVANTGALPVSPARGCHALTCPLTAPPAAVANQCGAHVAAMVASGAIMSRALHRRIHGEVRPTKRCSLLVQQPVQWGGAYGSLSPLSPDAASASPSEVAVAEALRKAGSDAGLTTRILHGCNDETPACLQAYLSADVIVLPPFTMSPYLLYARRTAVVVVADDLYPQRMAQGAGDTGAILAPAGSEAEVAGSALAALCAEMATPCVRLPRGAAGGVSDAGARLTTLLADATAELAKVCALAG